MYNKNTYTVDLHTIHNIMCRYTLPIGNIIKYMKPTNVNNLIIINSRAYALNTKLLCIGTRYFCTLKRRRRRQTDNNNPAV